MTFVQTHPAPVEMSVSLPADHKVTTKHTFGALSRFRTSIINLVHLPNITPVRNTWYL